MSIRTAILLSCDKCYDSTNIMFDDAESAKAFAEEEGWGFKDSHRSYHCPDCVELARAALAKVEEKK